MVDEVCGEKERVEKVWVMKGNDAKGERVQIDDERTHSGNTFGATTRKSFSQSEP